MTQCHLENSRVTFKKLSPKTVKYGDQKYFGQKKFLHYLNSKLLQGDLYRSCGKPYGKPEISTDIKSSRPFKRKKMPLRNYIRIQEYSNHPSI